MERQQRNSAMRSDKLNTYRKVGATCLLFACLLWGGTVWAQNNAAGDPSRLVSQPGARSLTDFGIEGLDERVNLRALDSWDVAQLIEFLAHRGGVRNIVIGKGVSGLTTRLKFDDVSVGEALEVVLSVNNLAFMVRNGIITIMTDAEYQQQFGTSFYDQKEVRMLALKYADPVRILDLLDAIKSSIGTVVADQATGVLVMIDTPAKVRQMEAVALASDIPTLQRKLPTETRTFVLQHAELADVQTSLSPVLSEEVGTLRTDARTRTLIVTDLPHKMREIEGLVAAFDRRSRQVFIEAKIVQVALNNRFELGVNWDYVFEGLDPRTTVSTAIRPEVIQRSSSSDSGLGVSSVETFASGGMGLSYSTVLGGQRLNAILQALEGVGETKILSNPHIATMDGEKAEINVTTSEPYSEAKLESGSTNVVGETFQFIDVGVSLDVTPRINDGDMINMLIRPEISSVIDRYTGAIGSTDGVPIVRTSYAETRISIKNGETIIIAGMIENEKLESEARVPILGRIPLIGMLFRKEVSENKNRELIVFLTPRIVTGERPYLRMRDSKKSLKPLRKVATPEGNKPIRGLR